MQLALPDAAPVGKASFAIHQRYHFQLAAGFMRSWLRDVKYQVVERTVTEAGATRKENFLTQTRDRSYRFLPTTDLIFHPADREFFPWKARYAGEKRPSRLTEIGALMGFSMTDPTKDFFPGGAWVPRSGIGLKGGIHLGFVDQLPPGVTLNTAFTNDATPITQKLRHA